jgi:hypothetical protein
VTTYHRRIDLGYYLDLDVLFHLFEFPSITFLKSVLNVNKQGLARAVLWPLGWEDSKRSRFDLSELNRQDGDLVGALRRQSHYRFHLHAGSDLR